MVAVLGEVRSPESYRHAARGCNVLIHTAFERGPGAREADAAATQALLDCATAAAIASEPLTVIYTSGVWVLGPRGAVPACEDSPTRPPAVVAWRPAHENRILGAAGGCVATAVVRPGCVYGGGGGLYGAMLHSLFKRREVPIVGDGAHRWASVYLDDLVELYRLVIARRPRGEIYHATDGSADMVENAAAALIEAAGGGTIKKLSAHAAHRRWGASAEALAMDQWISNEKARSELGWTPMMGSVALNATALLSEWRDLRIGATVI
jgi:nucleoside-diphosphate-sugar epimerase